jgi:hypothetical protein
MDLATLERNLRKAEQNVARCRGLIATQEGLIERLDRAGADTSFAKDTLEILRRAQRSYEKQRDLYAALLSEAKKA